MYNVDWLEEFSKKFNGHQVIRSLKERRFHGKLVINFSDGSPHTCHVEMCVKAYTGSERE